MLELKNVSKSFKINDKESLDVLDDVNFKIENNGLYFIVGKSGSGKSTLLNILQTILRPDSGEVLLNDLDIFSLREKEKIKLLKKDIGTIFQFYNLIDYLTVRENINLSKEIKEEDDEEYITSLINKYDLGDLLDQKVSLLSGGEKQRVAIIRSIISKPKILLCDEPTGALDHKNAIKTIEILKELSKKSVVIVVTHNEEYIEKYGDALFVLENKKLIKKFDKTETKEPYKENKESKKKRKIYGFSRLLAIKHIKNDLKINLISSFSILLTLLVFFFSFAFYNGYSVAEVSILDSFVNKDVFLISRTYLQNSTNEYIQISKTERPENDDIEEYLYDIEKYEIYHNLDYFFKTPYQIYSRNIQLDNVRFLPYFVDNNSNIFYANNMFYDSYQNDTSEYDVTFYRQYDYLDTKNNQYIQDEFELNLTITISEITDEFTYLNQPTIYYSYFYFYNLISSVKATNINEELSANYSWMDILENASKDDEICSYNKIVHIEDEYDILTAREKIDNYDVSVDVLKITSDNYTIVSSFTTLSESLFLGIEFFLFVTILCSVFLIGFVSFSSFMKKRKEVAILKVLGSSSNQIFLMFIIEELILFCLSFLSSLLLYFVGTFFGNKYLYQIFAYSNILNINIFNIFLIFIIGAALVSLCSYIPLLALKKLDIAKELKEE